MSQQLYADNWLENQILVRVCFSTVSGEYLHDCKVANTWIQYYCKVRQCLYALCYTEALLLTFLNTEAVVTEIFFIMSWLDQPCKCLQKQCNCGNDSLVSESHTSTQVTTFDLFICTKYSDLQQLLRREWYMHDTPMVSNLVYTTVIHQQCSRANKKHTNVLIAIHTHTCIQQGVGYDARSWMWCHPQPLNKHVCEKKTVNWINVKNPVFFFFKVQ